MRLTYIIRRINAWFARVVYERDAWDHWLARLARHGPYQLRLVGWLAQLLVWLTRRLLWLLMWIGQLVSSFMLRQMELDADRYEARVAGSEIFVQTAAKMVALHVAAEAAFSDLNSAWRERRLCDNLPELIRHRELEMPADMRLAVTKHTRAFRTGWFDTHPCAADRVANVRREQTAGIFTIEVPAAALFSRFEELCRRATIALYHSELRGAVQRENIIATEELISDRGLKQKQLSSLRRYFQNLIHPIRPVFPDPLVTRVVNRDGAVEMLLALRTDFFNASQDAQAAARTFADTDARLINISRVRALKSAEVRPLNPTQFDLPDLESHSLRDALHDARARREAARATINQVLTIGLQRLELVLSLADQPADAAAEMVYADAAYDLKALPTPGSTRRLAEALRCLSRCAITADNLRQHAADLKALLTQLKPRNNSQILVAAVFAASKKTCGTLRDLRAALGSTPYPYEHVESSVTLAGYAIRAVPPERSARDALAVATTALDAIYSLFTRILADLTHRAEAIESSLGLEPLPPPPDDYKASAA